jgi:hypothetical protein
MTDENNHIKKFTAADIEKYHKGLLSAKEMHALEKAALDDPFLADALEGYAVAGVNVAADIAELKKRLAEKSEETRVIPIGGSRNSSFPWLRAAIMIVVLAGAALLSYQFFFNRNAAPDSISQLKKSQDTVLKDESVNAKQSAAKSDTIVLNNNISSEATAISPGTVNIGNTSSPSDTAVRRNVTTKRAAFLNINPDSGYVYAPAKDENVKITAESTVPATTAAKPGDYKKNGDVVVAPVQGVQVDKKTVAEKEPAISREEMAFKTKAESKDMNKPRAQANATAGRNTDQDQRGLLYPNNGANFFRGQIMDANNTPLPFANVTNTRDNVGTYSDAKGYFVLLSPDSVLDVQVRSVGYENSRVRLRGNLTNNPVTLQEDRSLSAKILDTVKRNYRSRDGNLAFEEPEPADGWASYDSYLANNQNDVPEAFDIKKNSGSDAVELSFEVNKNGEPVNIRVEKSLCDKCDKEAIRLVKEGPKWKRKARKGKRTTVTVPFVKTD